MPEPFEELTTGAEDGYAVPPSRLGRPSRRSAWLAWFGLLAVAGLVVVAVLGPRPDGRPDRPVGSIRPSPTAEPTAVPLPTPWPRAAFGPGPAPILPIPLADRAGLGLLDPVSGDVAPAGFSAPTRLVFTDPQGRLVCLCLRQPWTPANLVVGLAIERYDPASGVLEAAEPPIEIAGGPPTDAVPQTVVLDADLAPDGAAIHVAAMAFDVDRWTLRMVSLAMPEGTILADVEIATFAGPGFGPPSPPTADPSPSPPPAGGLTGPPMAFLEPRIRVSPDGQRLRISLVGQVSTDGRVSASEPWIRHAWQIGFGDGTGPTITALADDEWPASETCTQEGFVGASRYLRVCFANPEAGAASLTEVVLETPDGRVDRRVPLGYATQPAYAPALVDDRAGIAFFWSPDRHVLVRLSAISGETTVRDLGTPGGDARAGTPTGIRPPAGPATRWRRLERSFSPQPPTIIGSSDGQLLYVIGGRVAGSPMFVPPDDGGRPASTGILVFNATSLDLVDWWAPTAAYRAIGLAERGALVLALGAPGIDAAGRPTRWGTSLTVLDGTGALSARYGDVANGADADPGAVGLFDPTG